MQPCYVMRLERGKGLAMLKTTRLTRLAFAGFLFASAAFAAAPAANPGWARVTTSMGEFTIELYPDRAPLTVANFVRYVKEGHYTNTLFHRVVSGFVVQ